MAQPPVHIAPPASFIELQTVGSTNNYALERAHAGLAQHGDCIFTHEQTAGKGQRGKTWLTPRGENILMSILIRPGGLSVSQLFGLSAAVAVAAHGFFSRYAGDATRVKWPNDLYWHDRKAGGILIENSIGAGETGHSSSASWKWAVIGMGININQAQFPDGLQKAVSLKQITGKSFELKSLALELYAAVMEQVNRLLAGEVDTLLTDYNDRLYKRNETVRLKQGSRLFSTLIREVTSSGTLITGEAAEERFDFGEVEWIIEAQ